MNQQNKKVISFCLSLSEAEEMDNLFYSNVSFKKQITVLKNLNNQLNNDQHKVLYYVYTLVEDIYYNKGSDLLEKYLKELIKENIEEIHSLFLNVIQEIESRNKK